MLATSEAQARIKDHVHGQIGLSTSKVWKTAARMGVLDVLPEHVDQARELLLQLRENVAKFA